LDFSTKGKQLKVLHETEARAISRRQAVKLAGSAALVAGSTALMTHGSAAARLTTEAPASGTPTAGDFPAPAGSLTIYCGRSETLVGGLVEQIEAATGATLNVRYGNTAELAAQILEEGENSPAGLYFGQDAGALGALAKEGRFAPLPQALLDKVEPRFRSPEGLWVGLSGRARVLVYNPEVTDPATLPASILDLPTAELSGPIGWAPTNASFQSFVTALRITNGEDAARSWLEGIIATGPVTFDGNAPQIDAVANQEIAVGLVNHYYLHQARKETPDISAENYFFPNGDLGSLINVAGVGILAGSEQAGDALAVTEYLLGEEAQTYFAQETSEYPLADGVPAISELVPLADLETPDIDLSDLDDLAGTLTLLTELNLI
jgi:iron(III) transport system substrate-binding protein